MAADLFASPGSSNEQTLPTEVREVIPKLELAESTIDPPSIQIDSGDFQQDLGFDNRRKTTINVKTKKDKKSITKFAMSEEIPCDSPLSPCPEEVPCDSSLSPCPEELIIFDAPKEETNHDNCCRNCVYR